MLKGKTRFSPICSVHYYYIYNRNLFSVRLALSKHFSNYESIRFIDGGKHGD